VGFSDSHDFRSNPLQCYLIPLHVIRWLLYELAICSFIFNKSKPANRFICSVRPYSHGGVPRLRNFTKINVSNLYEKQYTKRRTNSQAKIVVFLIQFEINFFPFNALVASVADTHKQRGWYTKLVKSSTIMTSLSRVIDLSLLRSDLWL